MATMQKCGRHINIQYAQKMADDFTNLMKYNKGRLKKFSDEEDTLKKYFYKMADGSNCYVFDKDFVTKFFESGADVLLVLNGVRETIFKDDDNSLEGEPTIILLGGKKNEDIDDKLTFEVITSTNSNLPPDEIASEHPDLIAKPDISHPITGEPGLFFTIY